MKKEKSFSNSNTGYVEIEEIVENGASYNWLHKTIAKEQIIFSGNSQENVELNGIGNLTLKQLNNETLLCLQTNTDVEDKRPRPFSTVVLRLEEKDYSSYNRIAMWVYPKSIGFQNFYFHFSLVNKDGGGTFHAPSLTPNTWNWVSWELEDTPRHALTRLSMGPLLMGCPPEGKPEIEVYFKNISMQTVKADYVEGWELQNRIAYSHSGYLSKAKKQAITGEIRAKEFSLINEKQEEVFAKKIENIQSDLGKFYVMDFSEYCKPGMVALKVDQRITPYFMIGKNAYDSSVYKTLQFYYQLRCGCDIKGVHSPCHLNSYTTHPDGRMVPNHGGWHDAGDVSQFEICTAEMAQALLEMAEQTKEKDQNLYLSLVEEARWGMNWLLRTRFGDGYRALSVLYSIWRPNVLREKNALNNYTDARFNNQAENGPFENFLAASSEAVAARVYASVDDVFADWCKRSAIEDFDFAVEGQKQGLYTRRWGPSPSAQVYGAGCAAAAELYQLTKNEVYLQIGAQYAKIVLACQQKNYPNWDKPMRGFFYEDEKHEKLLTYEHRGHEQTPVQGLVRLLETAPFHDDAKYWKKGIKLYGEYILHTADLIAPYGLIPAHIYELEKINMNRFTIPASYGTVEDAKLNFERQIATGIPLGEGVFLRRLPIAIQRRGYHATLLSKTKAITYAARVLKNKNLMQIALNQIEWIMGKNPFACSSMYGEGYHYHPLYVAFSRQFVGALPVGFKTLDDHDAPYWPTINNAVFKEVWGHTSGKYIWVLADLMSYFR
ncbi:MAG: glycoside hydrolase family 9 protein [Bacilli bacterium]|jgi:hypothetical protein|nr:glycoside hydrolase family 9 protein [Bacilli bacterium]MDY0064259.1 glycoside hydrolase family 9 protein [Bacilli bacterium]